ncbi:MAG: hypothetical protein Q7T38_08205 [Gallionella sp.]|nr:hypothetical protein [Gallionella sp.]
MDILFIVLAFFFFALLVATAPFTVPALGLYLLKRAGLNSKAALVVTAALTLALLAWPLSGLYSLSEQCENPTLTQINAEKLGPIDTLLIVDGIGRWWQNQSLDIERPVSEGKFGLVQANTGKRKGVSEAELRSRYRITIESPHDGHFLNRYLASGRILIEERLTGKLVARVQEPAWGGGVAGTFIAAVAEKNPFYVHSRYLSCGYTGKDLGVFRGNSESRRRLYQSADHNLVEQVFTITRDK